MILPGQVIISHPFHRNRILALIALTVIAVGVNLFGMVIGLTTVLSHLFYFPVILASYWYPRRGLIFSVGIAALYGIMAFLMIPFDILTGIVVITRISILLLVGSVVALLSWNLAESEQQLQDIIEFLPDATFAINREGRIIAWNRAIEVMTGRPKSAMLNRDNFEYALAFYGERRPMLAGLIIEDGVHIGEKYPQIHHVSGKLESEVFLPHFHGVRGVHLRFSATALIDTNGNVNGAIESVRDITEQVMTKTALENTGNRLNTLAGILRYDMSRTLGILYGQLQLGVMKFRDPDIISFISDLKESANGIRRQIDISREFRDIGATPPTWIRVQDEIDTAASRLDFREIIFHAWTERLCVFSDPHISAVFYHLLHNSLKESTGATKIIITYHIRDNCCAIIIEDDGTGIPDAEKGTLFVQREDRYGRGLFLATEILSLTGMSIHETGVYREGARFEIIIPSEGYRVEGMER
ncbi:MAG: PAS domain S-box protein [Methanoregula sp.]|nr:PAS domain S-box protein [Methanoregula sp.]